MADENYFDYDTKIKYFINFSEQTTIKFIDFVQPSYERFFSAKSTNRYELNKYFFNFLLLYFST